MDRKIGRRGGAVLLAAALVVAGLSAATAAKKPLTKKKANKLYVNVGEKASDADLLDGTDSTGFLGANATAADAHLLDGESSESFESLGHSYCDLVGEPANHAPCNTFVTAVHDVANQVGLESSLAIGTDGNPVIAHQDGTTDALLVTACNDLYCTGGNETTTTFDEADEIGRDASLAIGADGNPVISHWNPTADSLMVTKCNDPDCTGGGDTHQTVDNTAGITGQYTSLAIGMDGNPVISYHDASAGALKVAKCNDPACAPTGETITVVDDSGSDVLGYDTSIALGPDGNPVIAYQDRTDLSLKVARCNDPACAGQDEAVTTVHDPGADEVGRRPSLAIGPDGNPVIAHMNNNADALLVTACNDASCAGANETTTTVHDQGGDTGDYPALVIGRHGNPVIAYIEGTTNLNVAMCNDPACAGGNETIEVVDPGARPLYNSMAIGIDGHPVISYYADVEGDALKVTRAVL